MIQLKIYESDNCRIVKGGKTIHTFDKTLTSYELLGVTITQFNIDSTPECIEQDEKFQAFLEIKGEDAYPFFFINGELRRFGSYPTAAELGVLLGLLEDGSSSCTTTEGGCGSCSCGC